MTPVAKLQPASVRLRHVLRVDVNVPEGAKTTPATSVLGTPFAPQPSAGVNGRNGWHGGQYEDPLFPQEDSEGRILLTFPNDVGGDGRLHRRRFRCITDRADYRVGDEWLEVYRTAGERAEGELLGVYSPESYDLTPDTLTLRCVDAHFLSRSQRETALGLWTAAAPRDVFEHYSRAWKTPLADTFDAENRFAWSANFANTADAVYSYARASSNPQRGAVRLEPRGTASNPQKAYVQTNQKFLPSGWNSADAGHTLRVTARLDVRGLTGNDEVRLILTTPAGQRVYGIACRPDGSVLATSAYPDESGPDAYSRIGMLPTDEVNGVHEFTVELRDRWCYTVLDGELQGDPLPTVKRQGDTDGLFLVVELNGAACYADVTSLVVERTYDFLVTGPDKGDVALAVAPEPGPLVGEWFNDAPVYSRRQAMRDAFGYSDAAIAAASDLVLAPTLDPAVRRDEDVAIFGYDGASATSAPGRALAAGLWPTSLGGSYVSGRLSGAVYLDFDAYGDFAFRALADDRVRVWIGRTALRRDAVIDDWTAAGHAPQETASSWLRAGSSASAAPAGATGPLAAARSGWYPIVVEYGQSTVSGYFVLQVQRATQRGLWRTLGQSDYGASLRALAPADLLGFWPMHYRPGAVNALGTLEDNSGNGRHGAYDADGFNAARGAPGPARGDQADDFSGAGSSYAVTPTTLPATSTITVEAWVNPDTVAAGRGNIARRTNAASSIGWGLQRSGAQATFFVVNGTVSEAVGGALAVGKWSHVVGTYDGATVRLYVDGVQVASVARNATDLSGAAGQSAYIGATGFPAPVQEFFDGRITDVAFWQRALTAAETKALFDARAAAAPFVPTAPIGVYRERVRFDSHFEQLKALGTGFGYQYRLEPRRLESPSSAGAFPGVLIPRRRVGRDTAYVLDSLEGTDRQASSSAGETVDRLTVDAQGLADDGGKTQTLWQAIDARAMRRAFVGHHEYESLSDLSLPALVAARAEALLALRSSPTLDVGVVPEGKRELVDTFPLSGALAELAWTAGDALKVRLPELEVVDELPRQITRVVWPIRPDGVGRPAVTFRQRPRGLDIILRRALRTALSSDRNYQGQITTATGSGGKRGTGAGSDQYSRVSLPPGRKVVAARIVVLVLSNMTASPTVFVNDSDTKIPVLRSGAIDVTHWAIPLAGDARVYADLRGGTVANAEYVLEVDYLT